MRRSRRGHADPTLAMTPAPSVPALVRRGGLAVAAVGLMACGPDERTPAPADGAVQTGGAAGGGGLVPMFPFTGGASGPGGAPMTNPMPPMPYPGTGGQGSGGAPMPTGGAPMFPPFGSGGFIAPMPPPPPMPAPLPASLPRKR